MLIPVRGSAEAKSRLVDASASPQDHLRLVNALRTDTIAAALAATTVTRVVQVLDRAGLAQPGNGTLAFVQTAPGLNAALAEAFAWAIRQWPSDGVVALLGDLPALRPEDLDEALTEAAHHATAFVPDASGSGTTMLTAMPGVALDPRFGPRSAVRHSGFATPLHAAASLRQDVDTTNDLARATEIGLGPATEAVLREPLPTRTTTQRRTRRIHRNPA